VRSPPAIPNSQACSDPSAASLLPRALLPLLHSVESSPQASNVLRILSLGMQDHLALRTALIDSALSHGVEDHDGGAHADRLQLVLLGAGLDARAHRLASLAKVHVFEVDHPATQILKQRKAAGLPTLARELTYVPCDFQRTDLTTALRQARFDASAPSIWIWEGVIMYLPQAAVVDTLQHIAKLSAPDSLLIATYLTPEIVTAGALVGRWAVKSMGLLAEPVRCTITPDDLSAMFAQAGFDVLSDAAPVEAAPHYNIEVKRPSTLMPKERIAVASRV